MIEVRLVKSLIGAAKSQRVVANSLGLKRIGDVVKHPDNPATKGKIFKIFHLIEVV